MDCKKYETNDPEPEGAREERAESGHRCYLIKSGRDGGGAPRGDSLNELGEAHRVCTRGANIDRSWFGGDTCASNALNRQAKPALERTSSFFLNLSIAPTRVGSRAGSATTPSCSSCPNWAPFSAKEYSFADVRGS